MKILLGFVICFLAPAFVLAAVHGPLHLTNNPGAVALFLAGVAFGLCLLALILAGGLRLATGAIFVRTWWPSLISIVVLMMIALFLIEVTVP